MGARASLPRPATAMRPGWRGRRAEAREAQIGCSRPAKTRWRSSPRTSPGSPPATSRPSACSTTTARRWRAARPRPSAPREAASTRPAALEAARADLRRRRGGAGRRSPPRAEAAEAALVAADEARGQAQAARGRCPRRAVRGRGRGERAAGRGDRARQAARTRHPRRRPGARHGAGRSPGFEKALGAALADDLRAPAVDGRRGVRLGGAARLRRPADPARGRRRRCAAHVTRARRC